MITNSTVNPVPFTPEAPLRIAVLISGRGRTLANLLAVKAAGGFPNIDFPLVVSSKPEAGGIQVAQEAGISTEVVDYKKMDSAAFSQTIFSQVVQSGCQLIVLAGFLRQLIIPPEWNNRVVNIHPSLVPMFCGHGFYGKIVHQTALNYGVKISGCTVHFVNNEFDNGPVILQRAVPVYSTDTADDLAQRVLQAEFQALPDALRLIAEGRVRVEGRIVHILPGD